MKGGERARRMAVRWGGPFDWKLKDRVSAPPSGVVSRYPPTAGRGGARALLPVCAQIHHAEFNAHACK